MIIPISISRVAGITGVTQQVQPLGGKGFELGFNSVLQEAWDNSTLGYTSHVDTLHTRP